MEQHKHTQIHIIFASNSGAQVLVILFLFAHAGLFHVACRLTAENQAQADALALQQKHKQLSSAKEQERMMYLCLCDAAVGRGADREVEMEQSTAAEDSRC